MAGGLLGQNTSGGLLTGLLAPRGNFGATDEAMRRHREREAARLAQEAARREHSGPRAGQAPERERVGFWRALDGIFSSEGDGTISGSIDRERRRLESEAARPQMLARQAQLQSYVDTLSPEIQLAFATAPDKLGEAFATRAQGRVLDQGDVYLSGETPGYAAPFEAAPGASIFDPRNPGAPVAVAAQENKVAGGALVDPTGRVLYRGPAVEGVASTADAYVTPEVAQGQGGGAPRIERVARPDNVTVAPGGEIISLDALGNPVSRIASSQARPMSDADQTAVKNAEANLAIIGTASSRAQAILSQLDAGELNLGPLTNAESAARNRFGRATPNSLNYDALMNWAKEARDAILSANTGVQTDGDAVRALDRIISSPNDENVVRQAVQRFIEANSATAQVLQRDIARRQAGPNAAQQGGRLSPEQASQLPSGTRFVGLDGVERVKR